MNIVNPPGSSGGGGGAVDSITGTANQVVVDTPDGDVTLSLPQDIGTSSNVRLGGLGLGVAGAAGQLKNTQGTITASAPAYNHTATWNSGGVTFVDHFVNITSSASAAASLLMDLQVDSSSKFKIDKSGGVTLGGGLVTGGDLQASAGSAIYFTGRGVLRSQADGQIRVTNQSGSAINYLHAQSTSVSTSATSILPQVGFGGVAVVKGDDGSGKQFVDIVAYGGSTVTVVASHTVAGSPDARTYTVVSNQLKLAMAAGTYTVVAGQMGV